MFLPNVCVSCPGSNSCSPRVVSCVTGRCGGRGAISIGSPRGRVLSVAARSVSADKEAPYPMGVPMAGIDRTGGKGGDRDKALENALAQIERQFGSGSLMRIGGAVSA